MRNNDAEKEGKKIRLLLIVLFTAGVLPLLVAGFYNYPSADDFSMSLYVRAAFVHSDGNLFTTLREAFARTWYYYMNWTGYFFADFFMVLPPNVYGEEYYVITTPLLLFVYSFGVWFFVRQLMTRIFLLKKTYADGIALIILILSIQCMPEGGARVESFFWYCGSVNYTFLYGIALLWLGLLVRAGTDGDVPSRRRLLRIIVATILGFLLGGANYMTALSLALVSALVIFFAVRGKINRILIVPCALEVLGLICSALAPGNAVRAALLPAPMQPLKAVFMALYYTFSYCFSEWTTWAVLGIILLASPLLYRAAASSPYAFEHPVIVCALGYGLISCNIVPPLYAMHNIEAGRMQALIFEQYILLLVLVLFYCFGFFVKKGQVTKTPADTASKVADTELVEVPARRFYLAGCALFAFGALLSVYVNPQFFSATGALRDVACGDASAYHAECMERLTILRDDTIKDAVLPEFSVKPKTLYYDDIRPDADEWENTSVARYYGKHSVRLSTAKEESE